MSQSWEVLRKEARRLETDIESKLLEYSKLASSLQSSRSSALDTRPSNEGKYMNSTEKCVSNAERLTFTAPTARV